jgi:hypothetical protein
MLCTTFIHLYPAHSVVVHNYDMRVVRSDMGESGTAARLVLHYTVLCYEN